MTHAEILSSALEARRAEIFGYQINIDNYTLAIAKIIAEYPGNSDLALFRQELENLLTEEMRQQLRCKIIHDVIADQLQDLQSTPEIQ